MNSLTPESTNWLRDDAVKRCKSCSVQFNVIRRKHHCRLCQYIFCNECSKYRAEIPEILCCDSRRRTRSFHNIAKNAARNFTQFVTSYWTDSQKVRVCKKCLYQISRIENSTRLIHLLSLNKYLDIEDYSTLRLVNRQYKAVIDFFYKRWEVIQSRLVLSHNLLCIDKRLLLQNADHIDSSHPTLYVRLYQTHQCTSNCMDKRENPYSCKTLKCRYECPIELSIGQVLMVFYHLPESHVLFERALRRLSTLKDTEITSVCMTLVWLMSTKPKIRIYLPMKYHFCLYYAAKYHSSTRHLCKYFKSEETVLTNQYVNAFLFFIYTNDQRPLKTFENKQVSLPFDNKLKVTNTHVFTKRELTSASKPIALDIVVNGQTKTLMVKPECVLNDFLVQKSMECLSQHDIHSVTYYVAPLSMENTKSQSASNSQSFGLEIQSNKLGLILFEKAETLQSIEENYNTIQDYVLYYNPTKRVSELQKIFYKTAASSAMFSLCFGFADRHLNNILCTQDGKLFHIDFTYLFNSNPMFSAKNIQLCKQQIRLTPAMLQLIGKRYYGDFLQECTRINRVLRNNIQAIFYMFLPLVNHTEMSLVDLQCNFEQYLCSTTTRNIQEEDLMVQNIIENSSSANTSTYKSIYSAVTSSMDLFQSIFES